uniref:Uncharacterized protein n=1 Tax=Anopheles merus TaxID=30066 RepID=A0A182VHL6_ANOME
MNSPGAIALLACMPKPFFSVRNTWQWAYSCRWNRRFVHRSPTVQREPHSIMSSRLRQSSPHPCSPRSISSCVRKQSHVIFFASLLTIRSLCDDGPGGAACTRRTLQMAARLHGHLARRIAARQRFRSAASPAAPDDFFISLSLSRTSPWPLVRCFCELIVLMRVERRITPSSIRTISTRCESRSSSRASSTDGTDEGGITELLPPPLLAGSGSSQDIRSYGVLVPLRTPESSSDGKPLLHRDGAERPSLSDRPATDSERSVSASLNASSSFSSRRFRYDPGRFGGSFDLLRGFLLNRRTFRNIPRLNRLFLDLLLKALRNDRLLHRFLFLLTLSFHRIVHHFLTTLHHTSGCYSSPSAPTSAASTATATAPSATRSTPTAATTTTSTAPAGCRSLRRIDNDLIGLQHYHILIVNDRFGRNHFRIDSARFQRRIYMGGHPAGRSGVLPTAATFGFLPLVPLPMMGGPLSTSSWELELCMLSSSPNTVPSIRSEISELFRSSGRGSCIVSSHGSTPAMSRMLGPTSFFFLPRFAPVDPPRTAAVLLGGGASFAGVSYDAAGSEVRCCLLVPGCNMPLPIVPATRRGDLPLEYVRTGCWAKKYVDKSDDVLAACGTQPDDGASTTKSRNLFVAFTCRLDLRVPAPLSATSGSSSMYTTVVSPSTSSVSLAGSFPTSVSSVTTIVSPSISSSCTSSASSSSSSCCTTTESSPGAPSSDLLVSSSNISIISTISPSAYDDSSTGGGELTPSDDAPLPRPPRPRPAPRPAPRPRLRPRPTLATSISCTGVTEADRPPLSLLRLRLSDDSSASSVTLPPADILLPVPRLRPIAVDCWPSGWPYV